jgi:hypothetical protein
MGGHDARQSQAQAKPKKAAKPVKKAAPKKKAPALQWGLRLPRRGR